MDKDVVSRYAFLVLLLVLGYLSYLIIKPFLSYLIFSVVLVMLFHRLYIKLLEKTDKPRLSSIILVVGLIAILILPSILVGYMLITEAPAAYESFVTSVNIEPIENMLEGVTGLDVSTDKWRQDSVQQFRSFIFQHAAGFLSSATGIVIGLFIMFFAMFFLFTQGDNLLKRLVEIIPVEKRHQEGLLKEINHVTRGLIEGQLVVGIVQGLLGGIMFWLLGIPNPIFWGFVMIILSAIPFFGSFVVWLPTSIWLLLTGDVLRGVIMMIIGAVVISQIDNVLRPYVVSKKTNIHPAIVLVGVLGGLQVFGLIGFIVGPLIIALFFTTMRFYKQENLRI